MDEADWETVLRGTLLQQRVEGAARGALESIEVTATIAEDQIIVAVRKNTSGITQRLGEVILKKDEDQEIDTITWVSTAVVRSQALEQEVKELQNQFKKQGEVVAKLNEQLQNLIASQTDLKNTLFQKFAASLNKKKLKIRDQQRLLATAKVNQDKGSHDSTYFSDITYCLSLSPSCALGMIKLCTDLLHLASQIESLRNSPASSSPPFAHQDSKKRKPKSDPSMSPSPGTPEESDLDTTSDEL